MKKENYEAEKERFYSMFGPIANTVSIEKVTPLWKNLRVGSEEMINNDKSSIYFSKGVPDSFTVANEESVECS